MLRVIAAIAAFALCTYEGYRRSRILKVRVELLTELSALSERIPMGIRSAKPVKELIGTSGAFERRVTELAEQYDFPTAWEMACELLSSPERELMSELGRTLGSADRESALNLLESFSAELHRIKTAAEDDYSKRGKAIARVGTLCGIGAAVLLI